MNPLVTVGMPVFDGERFLAQAIESVLDQRYRHLQLVISDNASQDSTEAICKKYLALDSRISYLRQPRNLGVVRNSNEVFRAAQGKYFRWASYDDYTTLDHLEQCVDVLESHSEAVATFSHTVWIEGTRESERSENLHVTSDDPVARFSSCLAEMSKCNLPYGLIRTKTLQATRLFGDYIGSDIDLMLELSLYGSFIEIPEPLFFRRLHDEAASRLGDAALRQHYFPGQEDRYRWDAWSRHLQRVQSIFRAPLSWTQKLQALTIIGRHFCWDRERLLGELRAVAPWQHKKIAGPLQTCESCCDAASPIEQENGLNQTAWDHSPNSEPIAMTDRTPVGHE
ncbi:MAG: glycosyltransferase [Planctomycetota bacterium]|nr:glycosyltransferase [Planctomycetota bacterium]